MNTDYGERETYVYNEQNLIIEECQYKNTTAYGEVIIKKEFSAYDSNGNIINEKDVLNNINYRCLYNYNVYNHIIEIITSTDDTPVTIEERKITYY